MNPIKRWAIHYYNISPLFKQISTGACKQESFNLNVRVFAAYYAKKHQQKPISIQILNGKIANTFKIKNSYWLNYLQDLILFNKDQKMLMKYEDEQQQKFHMMILKFYNKRLDYGLFRQFVQSFSYLLQKDLISQFDHYIIDISFYSFFQLIIVSKIGLQSVLHCFGSSSLKFLEESITNQPITYIFSYISLINRLKHRYFQRQAPNANRKKNETEKNLMVLYKLFDKDIEMGEYILKHQDKSQLIHRQLYHYLLWLLYSNKYGIFIIKFIKGNYLYYQYTSISLSIISSIMHNCSLTPTTFSSLILLNEIIQKIEQIQSTERLSSNVKSNIALQAILKKKRKEINEMLSERNFKMDIQSINQLYSYDIAFESHYSITHIKRQIQEIISKEYYNVIYGFQTISKVMHLCKRIDQYKLYQQIRKSKNMQQHQTDISLINLLQQIIYNDFAHIVNLTSVNKLSIKSIYELKRVQLCLNKIKQSKSLQIFFSKDEISLLEKLKQKMNKQKNQLQRQTISTEFLIFFDRFYY